MDMEIPDGWLPLLAALKEQNVAGVVMVAGASHTGKSTLAQWLANELTRANRRVVLIDTDLGQSNVGPPGAMGLVSIRRTFTHYSELVPTALAFVGSLSPVGVESACANGLGKLLKVARRQSPHTILVNTCGFVEPSFVSACVQAVDPQTLVLLSRDAELEEVRAALPPSDRRVVELNPASAAITKSDLERESNREAAFEQYFQRGQVWSVLPVQVRVQTVRGTETPWVPGMLVGLLDGAGVCHGVGVSLPLSREGSFRIFLTLPTLGNIHRVLVGAAEIPSDLLKSWLSRPQSVAAG